MSITARMKKKRERERERERETREYTYEFSVLVRDEQHFIRDGSVLKQRHGASTPLEQRLLESTQEELLVDVRRRVPEVSAGHAEGVLEDVVPAPAHQRQVRRRESDPGEDVAPLVVRQIRKKMKSRSRWRRH